MYGIVYRKAAASSDGDLLSQPRDNQAGRFVHSSRSSARVWITAPLTYSYTTSAGNISGTGSSASETTSAANADSTITATANVVDARGLSTTCSATVTVLPFPVVAAPPEVISAGECKFNMSNKPGRVDNECKAVLDEVALQVQRQPNGKVVVVGYTDETETVKMTQLAGQRAVNVKYYLTSGEGGAGIDASRIEARAGTVKSKSAKIYIVPDGATFTEESTVVDETQVKGQPRNPTARRARKAPRTDMRIKEWPIVLTCSLQYWRRTGEWSAILPFYSLDRIESPEVVQMNDSQYETGSIRNNERGDLPLFHERQGHGGEGVAVDGARVGVHDFGGSSFESVGPVAFEETAEISVGDHAQQDTGFEDGGHP